MNRPNSLVEIQDGGVYNEMVLITGDKKAGLRLYGLPGKLPIIDAEGARPPEGFRRSCIALEADNVVVKGVCLM